MGNCNQREQSYTTGSENPSYSTSVLHQGPILGIDYYKGNVATSSEDKCIALTSAETIASSSSTNSKYLKGHTKSINCVKFGKKSGRIYSAARDLTAKIVSSNDLIVD